MTTESAHQGPTKPVHPPAEDGSAADPADPADRVEPGGPAGSDAPDPASPDASGPRSPRPAAPPAGRGPAGRRVTALLPGLALATAVAVAATAVGRLVPVVGAPVTGIVLGVLLAVLIRPGARLRPGTAFAARSVLQASVVLLGCRLSLGQVLRVGLGSLPVMLGTLAVCLAAAWVIGRALGIAADPRTLIGVGTGICGASAIAAVTPVIGAADADVAYAVSTIFTFNVAAVLVFPPLGHLLGMDPRAFGLFAGTAVNDMSSVVAAATAYGSGAVGHAVVVKLTRTLMIIPICLGLAAVTRRSSRRRGAGAADGVTDGGAREGRRVAPVRAHRLVPWFLVGFLIAAGLCTAGLVPSSAGPALGTVSVFLITVALSAIGLSTDPAALRRAGVRPLLLGGTLWVTVAASSLLLGAVTGHG